METAEEVCTNFGIVTLDGLYLSCTFTRKYIPQNLRQNARKTEKVHSQIRLLRTPLQMQMYR